MKQKIFSIVTVVYNDATNIERTIQSVLGQRDTGFEYIVIDGGSTDGTCEIISRYADRLAHFVSEPDGGIYDAMNKGAALASGGWVNFMNSADTFADEGVLSRLTAVAQRYNPDIIYGDIQVSNGEGGYDTRTAPRTPKNTHRMFFCHQSAFVRTDIIKHLKFDTSHRMSADFKFFKECFREGYTFCHAATVVAVFDTKGISNRQRIKGLCDNFRVVLETDRGKKRMKHAAKLAWVITYLTLVNFFRKGKK